MKAGITQTPTKPVTSETESNEPIEVDFSALFPESSGYTFQTVPEKKSE